MPGVFRAAAGAAAALVLIPFSAWAQHLHQVQSDSLHGAVTQLTARLDSLESGRCPAGPAVTLPARRPGEQPAVDTLASAVEALSARLEGVIAARCRAGADAPAQPADTTDDLAALRAAAAAAAGAPAGGDTLAGGVRSDSTPAAAAGPQAANLLNPEISATGDFRLFAQDEGPEHVNAEAHEFEFSFQSDLDPYSKTKIFLTFEDEEIGVEEGYIYYAGLPGRTRADLGKFRQPIGDLNRWHLHALPETEYPLVYQRFLGEDGLAGIGLSLYTALPVSIAGGTHEVWLQGTTQSSEPLYGEGHPFTPLLRLQNFWQLSRSTYTQVGFTATGGDTDDPDLRSRLLGLDFRLTYRPPEAGARRDITFRAEGYRLHATDLGVTTDRYGAFLDLAARTSRQWIFGVRYDYAEAPRGLEDTEWRLTPTITWWQSEFVYLRLEGQHRDSDLEGTRNLLTLQAVWAMGPHKHETY
ncbi:MAG TPA: hypothetical protein VFR62_07630 [Gemmatimonadales bacterium]|nr:hypothetical protein [Gemmatimonadales bacterium]